MGTLRCILGESASVHWLECQFLLLSHINSSESQSCWGWKRCTEVIWSRPPCWNTATYRSPGSYLNSLFLNICKKEDSATSGQPVPVPTCPQSKCFQMFRRSILCYSLCPLLSILSLSSKHLAFLFTLRRACLHLLYTLPSYTGMRYPLGLIFSRLNCFNSLNLSWCIDAPSPSSSLRPCAGL